MGVKNLHADALRRFLTESDVAIHASTLFVGCERVNSIAMRLIRRAAWAPVLFPPNDNVWLNSDQSCKLCSDVSLI